MCSTMYDILFGSAFLLNLVYEFLQGGNFGRHLRELLVRHVFNRCIGEVRIHEVLVFGAVLDLLGPHPLLEVFTQILEGCQPRVMCDEGRIPSCQHGNLGDLQIHFISN